MKQMREKHNEAIRELIANLGYGIVEAVQEYISIVLSNSVYPDHFPIEYDFDFRSSYCRATTPSSRA